MYTIEIMMKGGSAPVVVQQKEEADAEKAYASIAAAITQAQSGVLALNCDQTEKKVTVLAQEIAAVQLVPKKPSSGNSGNRPGFFAQVDI
ncbi:MAG: hypothetical protein AAF974_03640 [Cyanobacteria bacterium P01_E01_bin.34]